MVKSAQEGLSAQRLRVAVIGSGMIAVQHVRAARAAGAEVIGVLGSSPERSKQAGAAMGLHAFEDLEQLLQAAPDAAHVCTPNASHAPYALALARAGIHVVLEKPVATSVKDARSVEEAARAAGVVVSVPHAYRYHPMVRELRARRMAGEFGDIALVHGSYLQDWLFSPDASTWRVDPEIGGPSRAFADIGTHWCDLVEFVSGLRFTEVQASTRIVHPTRPAGSVASFGAARAGTERVPVRTEDLAVLTLRAREGLVANAVISQVSAGRKNRLWFELDGTGGSAVFDQENPESVWLGGVDGSTVLHRGEGRVSADQARLNRIPAGHPQGFTDAFDAFVADSYAAMAGAEPEGLPGIADGVHSLCLVDAVLESARTGEWTPVAG